MRNPADLPDSCKAEIIEAFNQIPEGIDAFLGEGFAHHLNEHKELSDGVRTFLQSFNTFAEALATTLEVPTETLESTDSEDVKDFIGGIVIAIPLPMPPQHTQN